MFKILSKANNAKEFIDMIPFAIDVLLDYGKKIIELNVDNKTLIFTTRISRDITQYQVNNLVKSALIQLRNSGIQTRPGKSIRYIVINEKSRNHNERVCIAEKIDENERVDVNYYLRQIAKCGESILMPFGYKLERLYNMLQKI
jgi:DNA polymerase elongation subunit (family B)